LSAAKLSFQAPAPEQLLEVMANLPPERASSHAAREVKGVKGTSLGGERPKLTVLHKGQHWVAKLQDRGDPPHAPLREFVAMRLARRCGINAAEVEFAPVGDREVLLVKRFDRHVDSEGPRSSAGSMPARIRCCAWSLADVNAAELKRELWRRMAFNAICGNGDDHPRNHGLLHRDGRWGLSDAFDIAPYITFSGTLAMAITRDGSSLATTENLLKTCENFADDREEAAWYVQEVRQTVAQGWREELLACGFAPNTLAPPSFEPRSGS